MIRSSFTKRMHNCRPCQEEAQLLIASALEHENEHESGNEMGRARLIERKLALDKAVCYKVLLL